MKTSCSIWGMDTNSEKKIEAEMWTREFTLHYIEEKRLEGHERRWILNSENYGLKKGLIGKGFMIRGRKVRFRRSWRNKVENVLE